MTSLLSLCDELLHEVFTFVNFPDLFRLAATCRTFKAYIKGNKLLWKDMYLQNFDEPPAWTEVDWELRLKDITHLQNILMSENEDVKRRNLRLVVQSIVDLLHHANKIQAQSRNIRFLQEQFENPLNRNVFLSSSGLYGYAADGTKRAGTEEQRAAPTAAERQLSAKLHAYFGTSYEIFGRTRSTAAHPYARSKVYDLRNYNNRNSWGPYLDDLSFRPDWEKIESIMIDLGFNMRNFIDSLDHGKGGDGDMYGTPFFGITPQSYVPIQEFVCPGVKALVESGSWKARNRQVKVMTQQPSIPLEARDPYGVSGTWRRIVCFLDYNDLYAFNFLSPDPTPGEMREPITTQEAIRLITMKIKVNKISDPGEGDRKDMPVVHFTGMSRSMHASWDPNANSKITGSVRMTQNGDVRWVTLSIFHGETRWRSECIQLGGIRSARGVIGTWFDKNYDPNGPAGPTAFWKVCEEDQGHVWEDEIDSVEG
ncbi:uncharacterized protein PV09_09549 [Verruconis gallopava]|uniref:F-box domain-containing protein n=1 Tax=Verruconis gallopava TaxID=253628 RepID=A0A0D2AIC4_9PEZI|nr:uncharacterized protein PV09_09549 [Verruconis gallopava]KIV98668.1 hypothetical protein PV09_09549 [Verruconis gallopava]